MANHINDRERHAIYWYALHVVRLGANKKIANYDEATGAIMHKFGISEDRAQNAAVKAASMHRSCIRQWEEGDHRE